METGGVNKTLEDVRNFLANIPYINEGGCAIAALVMHHFILRNEGIDCPILYLTTKSWRWQYEHNKSYRKGYKDKPTSCCHIVLKYKGQLIDCDKVIKMRAFGFPSYEKAVRMHPNQVKESLKDESDWNPLFERHCYLPIIEQYTGINLTI